MYSLSALNNPNKPRVLIYVQLDFYTYD